MEQDIDTSALWANVVRAMGLELSRGETCDVGIGFDGIAHVEVVRMGRVDVTFSAEVTLTAAGVWMSGADRPTTRRGWRRDRRRRIYRVGVA